MVTIMVAELLRGIAWYCVVWCGIAWVGSNNYKCWQADCYHGGRGGERTEADLHRLPTVITTWQ